MTPSRNEQDPHALTEQEIDFTAKDTPAPGKRAAPSPLAQDRAEAIAPSQAKPHREILTLKRTSRARHP